MLDRSQVMSKENVNGVEGLIRGIFGDDVWDDSARRTAERILSAWMEFAPIERDFDFTVFPAEVNQMIVVDNIEFSSLCAHHLFPFYGVAHVGYIPNELMVGVSKIPRLVRWMARRPRTQEKLTADIASFMKHELKAMGVAVLIEARHTCMACRGVTSHNSVMRTSEMRGVYLTAPAAREEFLSIIKRREW